VSGIGFSPSAWEQYLAWQQLDKKTLRRINELLKDIQRNGPETGIGKPEALKHRKCWSRRIDQANRLAYLVDENGNVLVVACKGHYSE